MSHRSIRTNVIAGMVGLALVPVMALAEKSSTGTHADARPLELRLGHAPGKGKAARDAARARKGARGRAPGGDASAGPRRPWGAAGGGTSGGGTSAGVAPDGAQGRRPSGSPVLLPPLGLTATVAPYRTHLSWSSVNGAGTAGYLVYRSTTAPVPLDPAHRVSTLVKGAAFTDTPPPTGDRYYYVVAAVAPSGRQAASAPVSVVSIDRTPPPRPTGVTAVGDTAARTVTVSWAPKAPTDHATVGYYVRPCSTGTPTFCGSSLPEPVITTSPWTAPWDPAATNVLFEVCAVDQHDQVACAAPVPLETPSP
jgi:hypothetical protein